MCIRDSSRFVTIAHQDDMYQKDYVKLLLESWKRYPDMTLFTGGYKVAVSYKHLDVYKRQA